MEESNIAELFQLILHIIFNLLTPLINSEEVSHLLPVLTCIASSTRSISETVTLSFLCKNCAKIFSKLLTVAPNLQSALYVTELSLKLFQLHDKLHDNPNMSTECQFKLTKTLMGKNWELKSKELLPRAFKIHLHSISPMDKLKFLLEFVSNCLIPVADDGDLSEDYPLLTKQNLPVFFNELLSELVAFAERMHLLKIDHDVIESWSTIFEIFTNLNEVAKTTDTIPRNQVALLRFGRKLMDVFIRRAIPFIGDCFKERNDEILLLIRSVQSVTRFLQAVANTCKDESDGRASLVPSLRKSLETFIYKMRVMVANNDCASAFWVGKLKIRNIQGDVIAERRELLDDFVEDDNSDDDEASKDDVESNTY